MTETNGKSSDPEVDSSKPEKQELVSELDPPPPTSKAGRVSKSEQMAMSKVFEMALGFTSGGPAGHPLFDKFNDEHVHKFLDGIQKDDDNSYRLQSTNRFFNAFYVLAVLVAFGLLFRLLLPQNKDLLVDILRVIVIFAGGLGAGFGLKSQIDKRKS